MKAYQVEEPGKPLVCNEVETPNPHGKEVLVKTISCGVCHSDIHFHDGGFTSAIRPHQTENFSLLEREIHLENSRAVSSSPRIGEFRLGYFMAK